MLRTQTEREMRPIYALNLRAQTHAHTYTQAHTSGHSECSSVWQAGCGRQDAAAVGAGAFINFIG